MNSDYNDNGMSNISYKFNNDMNNFSKFRNYSGRLVMNGANLAENMNSSYNKVMNSTTDQGKNAWNRNQYNTSVDKDRKRTFLNNIEQQFTLTNKNKLLEYEKKRKEDEKYLSEMQHYNPFGRGGAGAPIRDKHGNVVTSRKALISDPKYQRVKVNVDEEYNNLIRERNFNMLNKGNTIISNNIFENPVNIPRINSIDFNNNSNYNDMNHDNTNLNMNLYNNTGLNMNPNNNLINSNNPINNNNQIYANNNVPANTIDPMVSHNTNHNSFNNIDPNMNVNQMNFDAMHMNVKMNPNPNFDPSHYHISHFDNFTSQNGMSNGLALMNNGMQFKNMNSINHVNNLNTSLNNNDVIYNSNVNTYEPFENKQQQHQFFNNNIPTTNTNTTINSNIPQPNFTNQNNSIENRFNQIATLDTGGFGVNLSTNNENDDIKRQQKQQYGEILREQMRLNEERKEKEKELRKREEMEEEARIKREQELMKMREDQEKEKKKKEMDKFQQQNDLIREQYVQVKNKRNRNQINDEVDTKKKEASTYSIMHTQNQQNNTNYENDNQIPNQMQFLNNNDLNQENNPNVNPTNNFIFVPDNKEDIEIKNSINNEILKLRSSIIDQQSTFLKQINDLKEETQNANLHRYEAMKEISQLKEEISKQRIDEELRRKYVYDVMVDKNIRANEILSHLKLPEINEKELRVELPKIRNHSDNVKNYYYEDTIKHPNRIPAIPKLDEIQENGMKTTSKFIDIDTHNVVDSLNLYEPDLNSMKNKNKKNIERENARAFEVDSDFVLRSYFGDDDDGIESINNRKKNEIDMYSVNSDNYFEYYKNQKKKQEEIYKRDKENTIFKNNQTNHSINNNLIVESDRNPSSKIKKSPIISEDKNLNKDFKSSVDEDIRNNKKTMEDDILNIHKVYNKNLERLRFLNRLEEEDNLNPSFNSKMYFHHLINKTDDKNYSVNNLNETKVNTNNQNLINNINHENYQDYMYMLNKQNSKPKNFEDFLDKLNTIKDL